ncbi:MAG: COG2426 family protein [Candidatus Fimivivens sp.]
MLMQLSFLFFLSMVPVIELRGAIPIGIGWGYPFWLVYVLCVVGNLLPVPFLIPFAGRVLRWGAKLPGIGGLFQKILDIGNKKVKKTQSTNRALLFVLFLFVAIPAPGTGAWTGCLIATLLQMRVRRAFWPIAAGVATAGLIMGVTSYGLFSLMGA